MKFTVDGLVDCATCNEILKDGTYVSVRPDNWKYESFIERIRNAWLILIGKADAVTWEEAK